MFYSKELMVNGTPCEYHKIDRAELLPDGALGLTLQSWVSKQSRDGGAPSIGAAFIRCEIPTLMGLLDEAVASSELFQGAVPVDRD